MNTETIYLKEFTTSNGLLSEISAKITEIRKTKTPAEDIIFARPIEASARSLAAGASVSETVNLNRSIKFLQISCGTDVTINLQLVGKTGQNYQKLSFHNESVVLHLPNGIPISTLQYDVSNTHTTDAQDWQFRMVLAP